MVIIYFLLLFLIPQSNQRYVIESSKIEFYSYAPLEDISAINTSSIGVIDIDNGEFLIKIPMSSFEFTNKLMQKHFNDSYLETDKYPESIFRGKKEENIETGTLSMHGITNNISIPLSISYKEDSIIIDTEFKIILNDYKIKIPRLLFQNIAEEIEIKVNSTFSKYIKK